MTINTEQPARFISLEGGEGAGKSTQIKLLKSWLEGQDIRCIQTREPGGSDGAELIRDLLVRGATDRWTSMTEALLMTAARNEHVERTIKPALAKGTWVLCDRFFDSSVAYQGAGRGLGTQHIRQLQTHALGDFEPDLTLILDLPVDVGLSRAKERESGKADSEDRFERLDTSFHETLRAAYIDIANAEPDRCVIINANRSVDELHSAIQQQIQTKFGG